MATETDARAIVILNRTVQSDWGLVLPTDTSVSGSDKFYAHEQNVPSKEWVVVHGLGKFPAITVVDSAGTRWMGTEIQKDSNTVILQFAFPFSGIAYCN
jgi:hypothetical protein